jgi:hypothetical protein
VKYLFVLFLKGGIFGKRDLNQQQIEEILQRVDFNEVVDGIKQVTNALGPLVNIALTLGILKNFSHKYTLLINNF